jgi:predicted lactoylglutathione lyase
LDHVGVILESPEAVDRMYREVEPRLQQLGGRVVTPPKQHRDGSYSFYFSDPDGTVIQALYEPTISRLKFSAET